MKALLCKDQDKEKLRGELDRAQSELDVASRSLRSQQGEFVSEVAGRERRHRAEARAQHLRARALLARAAEERRHAEADLRARLDDVAAHRDDLSARISAALEELGVQAGKQDGRLGMVHVKCLEPIERCLRTPDGPARPPSSALEG
jgi:hypothetical protein